MMPRQPPPTRDSFRWFAALTIRWNDIDVFGHVNNAEFYAYFDSALVRYLHGVGAVSAVGGSLATLVVESGARFHREVLFTDRLVVGIRLRRMGTSSARYELAVFTGEADDAAVDGFVVHVFVGRETRRPVPIPGQIRDELSRISTKDTEAT